MSAGTCVLWWGWGAPVGAQAKVLGDGIQHVAVAGGLLPDVQLHHAQPKALHLQPQPSVVPQQSFHTCRRQCLNLGSGVNASTCNASARQTVAQLM